MDQELKQRLIGASVIIALAIIFVPMLFDGEMEQKNNQNISINIPEPGKNNLEVKKFELDKPVVETKNLPPGDTELMVDNEQPLLVDKDQANPITVPPANTDSGDATYNNQPPAEQPQPVATQPLAQAGNTEPATQPEPPVQQPTQRPEQRPEQRPAQPPSNQTTSRPTVTPSSTPVAAASQVLRVKLGSFSQQGNAERVKSSLLQNNIQAIVEYNPELKLYRVWSQDLYQDAARANSYVQAVERMNLNIGTPKVITLNANEVAQMAAQGQMGWVVQLGSFSAKNNAIELRNKVKAAGFDGYVDVITNASGKQLYRLRIGPLMERVDAEQTQRQIKQKLKLDGLVKNHELTQIVN
ncbi:SPOR domain-containing protein [Marinicella meishanensis]|uniref:SPOR domain-containing protein n=1 Tax=Marinicella meishanensis TaxID=2873263 RepID=UPI001CBADE65|nr:SPOR domain-containing protein [Marinicella sp. NBU2979]